METNKNPSGSGQDMLAIARRLAGLPADKRAIFRQRLRESGIDFSGLPIVPLSERPASIPLSFAQQRLWFLHQLEPGSAAYNIPTALKLEGRLDNAALESAFKAVIARHESLRTVFREIDGKAEQLVLPAIDFRLPVIDLSGLPCDEREAEALRLARTDAVRPFDLGAGPLMRAALLKLADTEHILAVTMHHIVSDGWSMNVLLRELGAHYAGKVADLRPLAIQYADFALWQQEWLTSDVLAAQLDYWKAQLGNEHPVLELPADRPRPLAQSGRGAKLRFTLSEALTAGLRQYAKEQGATLFMTTLAAFSVLLHRLSGQNDIRIGVPIANRNRIETENVIGFFVNTQVLRAQPDARMSFVELLARVKEAALGAQAHQDLPFEQLVEALQPERNLSHSPLFQAMFNLQTSRLDSDSRMGDMRVQALPQDSGAAQFDLSLDIVERQGRLEAALTYSTDLFEAATVERFAGYYTNLLDAIVAAPHARIGQLPMLGRDEYHQLTSGWGVAASVSEPFIAVHAQFEAQARTTPDAIALVYDDAEFTYAELNAQANRLAHRLIAAGIGADARAGVCIERSPAMIVALLAILKAGGAYVPLDPNYPAERLAYMIEDAGIALLLTQPRVMERLALDANGVTSLDATASFDGYPAHDPDVAVDGRQLAYVMYTSGSTGRPKGVGMIHAALAGHAAVSRGFFRLDAGERMLQFSTFNFDGFVEQLYPALSCGATVILRGPDLWDSEELYRRILRHRITVADFTTAYWFQVIQDWAARGYADYGVLRQVNVGGEAMPPEGLSAWRAAGLAHVRLLNTYGPTEAAVTAMIHDCAGYVTGKLPKPTQMPIGRALPGRAIYLLDADMNPVPIGAAGELCIGGDLLARGYHGRPDLTAERFIPDPFGQPGARLYRTGDLARWKSDGVIEYLGRIDHQVKLRGFRIELPEIEACLLSHPAVREAVVLVREDRPGDQRLVAYLVTTKAVTEEEVRSHVQTSLPDYMVPSAVVYLDAMPMNPNGKLDRKALPAPDYSQSAAQTAPRNAIEQQLAAIWSEVLGIETVGIHDNFFLLGGHSLLATRLVSRIRSALQCELPVRALFEAPTIAQLGERVQPAAAQELQPIPQVPRTGPLPLSSAQQRLWFLQQLEPNSAAYNMPAAVHLVGELDVAALKQAFEGLVARHETLRTTFREENGEAVQVIAPSADIAMPVVELSTLAAEAREAEVKRIAEAEAAKPFDLKTGPLLRLTLLKLSDTEHVLLATMHHIVSDGWSMSIFTREFAEFYAAASQGRAAALAPLPIQYADFAAWQRQQSSDDKLKRELDYWKTQLGTEHPVLELPADRPRPPVQSGRGARYRFTLDAALVHPLRRICRTHGATTFMALLAVFNILLGRLSGQRDIRVGVPIANRNRLELEGLIGFFVNTQVMRAQLDARMRFSEVLGRIKEAALGAQAHQDLPFEQLVEALQPERSLSHSPLFQVMFNLIQSDAAALPELSNLVVKPLIRDDSVAQFDLSLDIVEREASLDALFTYSTDLFDAATIERFAGYYTNLLRTVLADEETRIGQLPMLGDAELQCLTREWNTATESRNCLPPAHKLFEAQVEAAPQAAALVFDDAELSYAELNIRANRLAHRLVAEGVGPDKRVGICIERSVDMIVSLLAVLKAGGAYVPLDPNYPSDRLAYMADNAGIHIVLGSAHTLQRTGLARAARRALDVTVMPATGSAHNPDVPIRLGNLAYVMYTSGSTGKPKGVGITHDALARHSQVGCEFFALRPGERMLQFSTFNFDGFVEQLYPALSCGATVILRGPDLWDSEELYRRILRHRITVADFTTAYWFQVIQDWAARGYADYGVLRQVNVGGEAMPPEGLSAWRAAGLAHVRLLNTYGPTEAAVTAMIHDCAGHVAGKLPKPTQMPIGRALPGRRIYLLDADMNPVPTGAAGELCIGGELLARGYHGRPDLTAERFVPDPFGQPGARLYRTGDLARWKSDGVIEYLGRIDHQVKLRGFRIELPEIEACLLGHPAIREAVVLVREDRPGDKRLAAYLVTAEEVTEEEARSHVQASLPDYMVPSAFVMLDAMPMNPNGKLDRKALPAPDYSHPAERTAPRNAIEERLAAIWSEVLGIEPVGIHDNFFLLGGHSLLATRLASRIRGILQCDLPVRALFEAPTIAQLAERVQPATGQALQPIPQVPRTGPLPLSFAQQRLWFLQQLEPDSAAYNMPAAVRLVGELEVPALKRAFEELVERHETLRTTFREESGEAVQVIAPQLDISLPIVDLSGLAIDAREAEVKRISEAEAAKPFRLAAGPLMRLCLLKLSETEHVLLVTMHHIVSDDWSMSVFTREFAALYTAAMQGKTADLPPLAIQYADFAAWQRQWLTDQELDQQLTYWKTQLGNEHPVLELPTDRPRPPAQSGRGAMHRWALDVEFLPALQQLGRQQGATLFMTMLTAFSVLLHRLSGQDDIRIGVPIANRNRVETENVIGFFVNTQVLRAQLDARLTFAELLARVKEAALGAQAHQDLPFEQLVEALQPERNLSHSPLFQVMFNLLQADAATRLELPGLALQPVARDDGTTQFDLSLDIVERQGRLEAALTYSADLFEAATVERFAGYYTNLLDAIVAAPHARIGQLPMLGRDEYHQVTSGWGVAASVSEPFIAVHAQFEAQARTTPDAIALVYDDAEFTYAELNAQANRLAYRLIAAGIGADARAGVCIERSPAMIVALLAILKAGGAYVPLDPNYPAERLAYMIEDAGITLLLTQPRVMERLALDVNGMTSLDATASFDGYPAHDPDVAVDGRQLAYVMYTSGSTGKPKGVGIPHAALTGHVKNARGFNNLLPGERVLQFSTFNFDAFVEQLYPALSCGATVVLRGPDLWDSEELYRRILRHRITVADFTTAYWFQVIQDWAARGYTDYGVLRQVSIGGEAMPPEGLSAWREAGLAHVRLLNTYGPTEATVVATIHDCAGHVTGKLPKPTQMPIGRALPGRRIYLLDADMNPVPIGAAGELCIGGELLARGYHGRAELTAERFIPDPFGTPGGRLYRTGDLARWKSDGVIEYLGRIDHQVKIRGFRIELPEIEACLLGHPTVREAVVLVREDRPGDKRLVAYLTARGEAPEVDSLRRHLAGELPDYMVPSAFVVLDAMPMNTNGKLDRKALPMPDYATRTEQVAPRNTIEVKLAQIWREVLGIEAVGIHDNFFLLGGHSLLATRLASRIRSELERELPVRALFEAPTIAQLAERVQPTAAQESQPIPQVPRTGPLPLSFAQQRLWFLQRLEPDSAAYNMPAAVRLVGDLDVPALKQAFETLTARHETLRTTFREEGGEAVQVIAPSAGIAMPLVDLTAMPREASEAEVKRIIAAELERPFDLTRGPVLRIMLLKLSAAEHVLLLVMHHIAADGWSIGVLVRELGALYAAFREGRGNPLAPLSIQYADFAAWQRKHLSGEELRKQLAYWRAHLGSDHPVLDLPADRPRPAVMSGNGERYRFEIDRQVTEQLHALSRAHGATLFMTLLAAFDIWLHAHTGRLDPIVGTDIANRNRTETEGLLGFFINQLALKADLSGNPAFSELLTRTRHRVLDAYAHQDLPFNKLVEALNPVRSLAYTPLFQVKLVLQNQAEESLVLPGLEIKPQSIEHEEAEFDLLLVVTEMAGGLECLLKYSTDLFDRDTIVGFARQFAALLARCASEPSSALDTLAHAVSAMAREARVARQQTLSTQGLGKLQATRRKSISLNSTSSFKDGQS